MTGTSAVRRRGRHRKPRPHKVLLATGGLAVAAGVLSLVQLAPDGGGAGAPGTAEAEPRLDPTADATTARSANAAATIGSVPTAAPSAAGGTGGASPAPTATTAGGTAAASPSPSPSPTALPSTVTVPTTIPAGPARPPDTLPPTTTAPTTTTTPSPTPAPSTHQPTGTVCLPIVGLCVNPLTTG
ncbi:hypothetical protein [Streptomyces arenae]|uniref:hypothetical protein n=1 Tax=Streptomyces arenae TaxID=29301 RepID=UPI002657D054|nr:hypothetical protein [Streptomyces arenae]MCG7208705.1 hypothetical protein [Streptomyces arenae]